jgi:hypothetical protein
MITLQGMGSGTRPTTYENDRQNRGSNHAIRNTYKRLYDAKDPVKEETNNGDDLWQEMQVSVH